MASGVQWHQIIKVVQIYPTYVTLAHYFYSWEKTSLLFTFFWVSVCVFWFLLL